MARVISHGKEPFERIVERHGATVLRVCRAVVGRDDGDDAWSETFLAAMSAYPELPAGANVQAWLVTIAHRKSIDLVRARARAPVPVAAMAAHDGGTREHAAAADQSIADGRDDLWQAVAALPERQRHVIAYHYLGGLTYQQVAEILGGSTDAARRAAADGMASLRRTLIDTGPRGDRR